MILSPEILCCQKWLATRKQVSDEIVGRSEMEEILSVEALVASPLFRFIHIVANDCKYSGTRLALIANWAHPLFLKANLKASKENTPSWM